MKIKVTHQRFSGFTLLEGLLYIALLSILMTSALAVSWELIVDVYDDGARVTTETEGNFVIQKVAWALGGTPEVLTPRVASSTSLVLNKKGFNHNPVTIRFNAASSSVEMQESRGALFLPLTTRNVQVESLVFTYLPPQGSGPPGMQVVLTLDKTSFERVFYIRK